MADDARRPTLTVVGPAESERLARLAAYAVLDTEPEAGFDALTAIAASICDTPIALVSLVDEQRQWFKARVGVDVCSTSRDVSMCQYTILQPDPLIVEDTTLDPRFAESPLVTGTTGLRFYAGAPLLTPDGHALGALCVMDTRPRRLSEQQIAMLVSLAGLVVDQLELRRTSLVLREAAEQARTAQAEMARRSRQDSVLLSTLVEGVVVSDETGTILECNTAATAILGLSVDQLTGRTSFDPRWRAIDEDGEPFPGERHPAIVALRTGEAVHDVTMGVVKPSGELTWLLVNSAPILTVAGGVERVVTGFADITARKQAEEALVFQSLHDPLTGLANRSLFRDRLEHALAGSRRSATAVGVLYIDLDGFKQVNDLDGHGAGDQLLILAAERLSSVLRAGDTVARLGGDEFAVICLNPGRGRRNLRIVANRLLQQLCVPFPLNSGSHRISASIGIAVSTRSSRPETLLAEADAAMYEAKNAGRNQICEHPGLRSVGSQPLGLV